MDRRFRVKLLCDSIEGPTEANWPVSPSLGLRLGSRHCDNAIYVYARPPFTGETASRKRKKDPLSREGGGGARGAWIEPRVSGGRVDSREIHREDSVKIQLHLWPRMKGDTGTMRG